MTNTKTSADLRIDVPVAASADQLRDAIARVEDWWSTRCEREGDEFTVRFGENWTRMRVDGGIWTCTGQDTPAIPVPDEWVGDTLTFAVEATGPDTSILHFAHHGLMQQDCVDMCTRGWNQYVPSLVALAETGTGAPTTR